MRLTTILVAAVAALSAHPAAAAVDFPDWDVSNSCSDFGTGIGGSKFTKSCMMEQDAAKYMAKKHWSKMSDADREECLKSGQARRNFKDYRGVAGCMQGKICGQPADMKDRILKGPKECAAWQ